MPGATPLTAAQLHERHADLLRQAPYSEATSPQYLWRALGARRPPIPVTIAAVKQWWKKYGIPLKAQVLQDSYRSEQQKLTFWRPAARASGARSARPGAHGGFALLPARMGTYMRLHLYVFVCVFLYICFYIYVFLYHSMYASLCVSLSACPSDFSWHKGPGIIERGLYWNKGACSNTCICSN